MVHDSAASGTNKTRLQKLQSRADRLLTGSDPCNNRTSELGWFSYNTEDIKSVMIYKCRNGLTIYVTSLILMIVSTPSIPKLLVSFERLKHTLPTITIVSQYKVWTSGIVFPEILRKAILCHVIKVHYLSLLMLNPNFNLMFLFVLMILMLLKL